MAKYTNPNPGTFVTVNHKGGHTRFSHGDIKELPEDAKVAHLLSLKKLVKIEEEEPAKPSRKKADPEPTTDTNSNQ